MKQEYKVESLNTCVSKLQRQTYSQRMELEGCPLRICRISKRGSSITGRIGTERERLAPEPTTNSLSSSFMDAAGIIHSSEGEWNVAFSFSLSL